MKAEQQARAMLDRMGVDDVDGFTSGDLVELANLIAKHADMLMTINRDGGVTAQMIGAGCTWGAGDKFLCYKLKGEEA